MAQAKISKLLAYSALCSTLLCGAASAKEIYTNMAHMQAMDKITGKVSEIDVPVNGEVIFGSFSVVVRTCATRPPEETPENYAFVDVVDNYDSKTPVNIFKGWMMSSSPALSAIEHPIYDVWLLKCYDGDTKNKKILSPEELKARDEIAKAEPKSNLRAENKAEDLLQIPEKQPKTEEMMQAAEVKDSTEDAAVIPASAIEQESVSVEVEDGAPKSLIVINNQQEQAPAEQANPSENNAAIAEEVVGEIKEETVSVKENSSADISESAPLAVSGEALIVPATEEPALPPAGETDKTDEITETVPLVDNVEPVDDSEQLIKFDDEVEEDGFELNVEALKN